MTMPNLTRTAVERADTLEFPKPAEKQVNIEIAIGPSGMTVTASYTGTLSSIPAAIERLRAAGVLQLVDASRPAAPAAPAVSSQVDKPTRKAAERVDPAYQPDGTPCCPKHNKPLKEGQWGLYCPAKDASTDRGYCSLKFTD